MIRAAVIGPGWWRKTVLETLLTSTNIVPVFGVGYIGRNAGQTPKF
jgi:hypothetical protein